jgi:oxygen-independent coproporphyrinogen-3 oxidase
MYESNIATTYVTALKEEIERSPTSLSLVDTIYFGGGTPSLLDPQQLNQMMSTVRDRFSVTLPQEVTMEMNPGSAGSSSQVNRTRNQILNTLSRFRELGITRVSFGAQTFDDNELARLGRSHSAEDIRQTFVNLRDAGFDNVSLDLIAGLPGQTLEGWRRNLSEALSLRPEHISFYLLEVHQGTPLAEHIRKGIQPMPNDDLAAEMYEMMLEEATSAGYQHYEISNLCLPGYESRHNTKYWTNQPYLGFGCSAHSYDGVSHRWANERDVNRYIEIVHSGGPPVVESHHLTEEESRAEAVFLGLRMMRGLKMSEFRASFGFDLRERFSDEFVQFQKAGLLESDGDYVRLTRGGALLSNEVFASLS